MSKTSPHANLLDSLNKTVLASDATISVDEKKTNIILLPPIPFPSLPSDEASTAPLTTSFMVVQRATLMVLIFVISHLYHYISCLQYPFSLMFTQLYIWLNVLNVLLSTPSNFKSTTSSVPIMGILWVPIMFIMSPFPRYFSRDLLPHPLFLPHKMTFTSALPTCIPPIPLLFTALLLLDICLHLLLLHYNVEGPHIINNSFLRRCPYSNLTNIPPP